MALKKGDFVELNYTGKLKDGTVYDTTDKAVAEESKLPNSDKLKPIIVCIGEGFLMKALEEELVGKELGKVTVSLSAENAFGKKDPKKLELVPMRIFKAENIQPVVGLQVTIDDDPGVVRSVSGGRVVVDFNHPLASQDVDYDIELIRIVADVKEKVEAVLKVLQVPFTDLSLEQDTVTVKMSVEVPDSFKKSLEPELERLTGVKKLVFKK